MKVLFIASGNHGAVSPVVGNQAEALMSEGIEIEWYLLKGKGLKGYLKNVQPLSRYLKEHKYDAIHAHYSLSAFVASLAGAKPLVVSLMGSDVKAAGWYKFIIRLFARLYNWRAIIVKSNDMYLDLGIEQAIVVPNGVTMGRFKPMNKVDCQRRLNWKHKIGNKHILFPAKALRPEKDFALAEASFEKIREFEKLKYLNVDLHVFEDTPNEETPYWYNAADVVLLTSKWEGSPNAIKEAMACSRPIVTTKVGDVSERLNDVYGCYVVPSREPKDIAVALEKALLFEGKTNGRERIIADGLANEQVAKRISHIYENIIK